MPRTVIKANISRSDRSLHLFLLFDRHVVEIDLIRCRRAFALAAKAVFTDQGATLETLNFEAGQILPALYDTYPYNLGGWVQRVRGKVTVEQRDQFCEVFGQILSRTGEYAFQVQRRNVGLRPRSG